MTESKTKVNIEVVNYTNNVDWVKNIVLIPSDKMAFSDPCATTPNGKCYVIARNVAMMSGVLKDLLEDKSEGEEIEIPLANIDGKTLATIMMYVNYFVDNAPARIPKPMSEPIRSYLSEWEKKFLDNYLLCNGKETEHQVLINVLSAAHYLNIPSLISLSCASVADMMKNKTTEQIRNLFHIENDFTPEEEEQIKKDTKWCDDAD